MQQSTRHQIQPPIFVRARAIEAKLEILRTLHLQHISNTERNFGPAPAAEPATAPASAQTLIAKGRNAVRRATASPRDETIPPLPPREQSDTIRRAPPKIDVESLWAFSVTACRTQNWAITYTEMLDLCQQRFSHVVIGTLRHYLYCRETHCHKFGSRLNCAETPYFVKSPAKGVGRSSLRQQ